MERLQLDDPDWFHYVFEESLEGLPQPRQPGGPFREILPEEVRSPELWIEFFDQCARAGIVEPSVRSLAEFFALLADCQARENAANYLRQRLERGGWQAREFDPSGELRRFAIELVEATLEDGSCTYEPIPVHDGPEQLPLFPGLLPTDSGFIPSEFEFEDF